MRAGRLLLGAAFLLSSPLAGANDGAHDRDRHHGHQDAADRRAPPWSALSERQQHDLARFRDRWDGLPPARRAAILHRHARWSSLPPDERERVRHGERNFRDMPPALRKKMRHSMAVVRSLPDDEQRRLRRHWRALSPDERRAWLERGGPGVAAPP